MSKCCMAEYCIYSDDGINCETGDISDKLVEDCPYLNAIGEINRLSTELALRELKYDILTSNVKKNVIGDCK